MSAASGQFRWNGDLSSVPARMPRRRMCFGEPCMRHSRSLTKSENWELATMLTLIVLALAALTLFWRVGGLPRLWAVASDAPTASVATPDAAAPPVLSVARLPVPARLAMPAYISSAHVARPQMADLPIHVRYRHVRPVDEYWYHGRKYVYWKTYRLRVTSYAPDRRCCWPYNGTVTASGKSVWTNDGHLVAADTRLIPFSCMVRVPGYDHSRPVPVLDRGGAIHGYRMDVLLPTFWQAAHWGHKFLSVKVYRPIDIR